MEKVKELIDKYERPVGMLIIVTGIFVFWWKIIAWLLPFSWWVAKWQGFLHTIKYYPQ